MIHNTCLSFAATLKWDACVYGNLYYHKPIFFFLWAFEGELLEMLELFLDFMEHLLFVERSMPRWEILVLIFVHLQV